jgi:hypothetical protein
MALTDDDRATLEALERRLLDPAVRRSPDEEFIEVGQSGRRYDRPAIIAALRSSIWRHVGDRWRVVYHQGTPAS